MMLQVLNLHFCARISPKYLQSCPFSSCSDRVDHLYTFFVQWSPEILKKNQKPHYHCRETQPKCHRVAEKKKTAVVNKHLTNRVNGAAKNWEVRNLRKKRNL